MKQDKRLLKLKPQGHKMYMYRIILVLLVSFLSSVYGDEGHDHAGLSDDTHKRSSGQMHNMKPDALSGNGYIRSTSPAGYSMVIGRKNPLLELKPEIITEDNKAIKVFELTVEDVKFEIFPGKIIQGWGFNGLIPGPTMRVKQYDRIRIILKNNTDTAHTMHVHGQVKPLVMDGVPYLSHKPVEKGEKYTYEFTVRDPGTHWYHCHVDSAHHVDMGMYGAFIVEPAKEEFKYDRDYTMILDEWPTAHVHIHEDEVPIEGHKGHGIMSEHPDMSPEHEHPDKETAKRAWYPETHKLYQPVYDGFTINGRAFPYTEPVKVKEGEEVRMRFINAGYKSHFMHTHSHKFIVVARSGSPVDEPQKIDTVEIGAGQRVDIILFADNPGIWPFHCHRLDHVTNEHIYPGGMMTFI
jgi:FtsP/CotA-like multicopper oxidase with cupredoxin domain